MICTNGHLKFMEDSMKYIKKLWPSIIISWVLFGLGIVGTILIVTQSQKLNLLPMMESNIVRLYL